MKRLSRPLLLQALSRLGELACEEGLQLECCVYGGALMMLAFDARASTKDVDVVIRPREAALRLAHRVGVELGLPENWMNDQVRTFLAPTEQLRELPIEVPGLHLTAPTAGYLLAMKALACRNMLPGHAGDVEDLRFLIRKMDIRSVEEIQMWIDRFYPDDVIPAPQRETLYLLVREVWA
jgi:hypothetical protein